MYMMDGLSQGRFVLLKKRLEALHYTQSFSMDSVPLIEYLLNDLVNAAEGNENIKEANDLKSSLAKSEQALRSLQNENNRFLQENNELRSQIVAMREENDLNSAKWQTAIRSLQSELENLRFCIQFQEQKLKKKAPDVLQPLKPATIEQKENQDSKQNGDFASGNEATERAEAMVKKYQEQLKEKDFEKKKLRQQVLFFEKQLSERNAEINRLNALFKVTGGNTERLAVEFNQQQAGRFKKQEPRAAFPNKQKTEFEPVLKKTKDRLPKTVNSITENARIRDKANTPTTAKSKEE